MKPFTADQLKVIRGLVVVLVAVLGIYVLFFRNHFVVSGFTIPMSVSWDSLTSITWSNKPFYLKSNVTVKESVIVFDGKTSAPENAVFQVFVNRELILADKEIIKTSMLPHVGDVVYENPVKYHVDKDLMAEDPRNFFGLVKNGVLRFKVVMYHPLIQSMGQTLDSLEFRFDKFDLVTFKIRVLNCIQCPAEQIAELPAGDWIDFKEVKSIPIKIYATMPSPEEIELIDKQHNSRHL